MKSTFQRIIGYNLLALLVAAVVLRLLNQGREGGLGFAIMFALFIGLQTFLNLLAAIFSDEKSARSSHWLSLLLVLLVGFGACAAGASISL